MTPRGAARLLCVLMAAAALAAEAPARGADPVNLLANPSMDEGGDVPAGWDRTENVQVRRDTEVFLKGPASLCVVSDGRDGNANQKVTGLAGQTVVFSGPVRREAGLESAQVFALTFDRAWKSLGWKTLLMVPKEETWHPFEAAVEFPPNAGTVLFGVLAKGKGRAWLDEVSLVAVDPAEARRRKAAAALKAYPVHDLSRFEGPQPRVLHVGAVAPDILCLHVREREIQRGTYTPYQRQDGDEIVEGRRERRLKRGGKEAGWIGGSGDRLYLRTPDRLTGKPLQLRSLHDPAAYALAGPGGLRVEAVYRKTKPFGYAQGGSANYMKDNFIFLQLSGPLTPGAAYTLDAGPVSLDPSRLAWTHDPARVRSEAVHVSHVGFRPDDPAKVAYLSVWLGTGGPYTGYREGLPFYGILDPKFMPGDWGFKWITGLHMEPGIDEWPLLETFCDVYHWPLVDEYTVVQSLAPSLYVWGYLAARDRAAAPGKR